MLALIGLGGIAQRIHHRYLGGDWLIEEGLGQGGLVHGGPVGVSGRPIAESLAGVTVEDRDVIRPFSAPLMPEAGMLVLRGNLFDTGVMKTSVISGNGMK